MNISRANSWRNQLSVQGEKKGSMFYVVLRERGLDETIQAMNRLAKLRIRWLANQGFSIGIKNVLPGANPRREDKLVEQA